MYCSKYRKLNFLWSKPEVLDKSGLKEEQISYGFYLPVPPLKFRAGRESY